LMNDALSQLEELAAGGIAHARFAHGIEIQSNNFSAADKVLAAERSHASQDQEMLAACYGAWIGMWAIKNLNACWTGLHEPCSPRLMIGGVCCSPIDAVKRILNGATPTMSLSAMNEQMQAWSQPAASASATANANAFAWDRLADNDRFAGEIPLPRDRRSAIAALDPWLAVDWQPGCRLLCLGAGGGRQGPLHTIAGAEVTVVDISARQLDHDRIFAAKHGLSLSLIQCSADRLEGLDSACFDLVVQPVSACYLPDVRPMYREVARVLRPGGSYLVQHKQPMSMRSKAIYEMGYAISEPAIEGRPLPIVSNSAYDTHSTREPGTVEYAHSLQSLIGELCIAGFSITHFSEPVRADAFAIPGTAEHLACFIPPYFKLKAINQSK
jgi:SAM-dependent methyltransferase